MKLSMKVLRFVEATGQASPHIVFSRFHPIARLIGYSSLLFSFFLFLFLFLILTFWRVGYGSYKKIQGRCNSGRNLGE